MGLGTAQQTITTGANFIPEIWVDQVRAYLEANLVAVPLIKNFRFEGQKGDILHVPDVTELSVNDKAANTQVTLQAPTEGKFDLTIDKHKETSFLVEDILAAQSSYELMSIYTKAAGYAIAKKMDADVLSLQSGLSQRYAGGNGTTAFTVGNGSDLAEAGIRQAIEYLDSANVEQEGRALIIHPAQKNVLLGVARFTEYQMVGPGGMPIRTGQFGEIFGVPVYVTTNVASVGTTTHANLLLQRDAFAIAIQKAPRVQSAYILEYLGWLTVVDCIYGYAEFRDAAAVGLMSPH